MKYSVIIPTLNEAENIEDCIASVRALNPAAEIIVADGGSTDGTVEKVSASGVTVIVSSLGRGMQCNAGAATASGDILVFLHADTELPTGAFAQLDTFFADEKVQIGTFRLSFDVDHWLLKLYVLPCELDLPFTRFGDQCIVVRRSFFEASGGFPGWGLYEDLGFINRSRRQTRIHRFPGKVRTSARRFLRNGILRQQLLNIWYTAWYLLGTSPDKLAARYERAARRKNAVTLAVFARFPHRGKVKQRLARSLGHGKATSFYRLCAEHVFRQCEKMVSRARLCVFFDDDRDTVSGKRWAGPVFQSRSQVGGDLGRRLVHAFDSLFEEGARKAIILASDVPDITKEVLVRAVNALDDADVVIGPCFDGGYYLIGMKKTHTGLFDNISWSTPLVYKQTMEAIETSGLRVYELPRLMDIDTEADLERWLKGSSDGKRRALKRFIRRDVLTPV